MTKFRHFCAAGLVALVAAFSTPSARAAEPEPYLPDDSGAVVIINTRQLFDSALFKQFGADTLKQLIKDTPEAEGVLKDLGLEPARDTDRVTVAVPGVQGNDRGLIVFRGTFDVEKFKARGEEAAKNNGDVLKIHKTGRGDLIYEVILPDNNGSLFVSVISKNVIVASPAKDYIQDALKKDGKKATLTDKQLQKLLENVNEKQGMSVALVGQALKDLNLDKDSVFKPVVDKLDAVGGGVLVTDEVKLEFMGTMKDADSAKAARKTINDNLNLALAGLAPLATASPRLEPAVDLLKSLKVNAEGNTLVIKGSVDADTIRKALKDAKQQ